MTDVVESSGVEPRRAKWHIIYSILEEYGLGEKHELSKRLRELQASDWRSIADTLETWYAQNPPQFEKAATSVSPLTFSFLPLPGPLLPSLARYLPVADSVWLDDLLYDSAILLQLAARFPEFVGQFWKGMSMPPPPLDHELAQQELESRLLRNVEAYVRFYLEAKELVLEGRLMPYKVLPIPHLTDEFSWLLMRQAVLEAIMEKMLDPARRHWALNKVGWAVLHGLDRVLPEDLFLALATDIRDRIVKEQAHALVGPMAELPPVAASCIQVAVYAAHAPSTDLVSADMAYMFRLTLRLIEQLNSNLPSDHRIHAPMQVSRESLPVLLLDGIPIQRVLDAVQEEPQAWDHLRASLTTRLRQISAPPGSLERDRQIARSQAMLERDLGRIRLAYDKIRANFTSRFSLHLPLAVIGIAVAGAGVAAQNLDTFAPASRIAGATGIASGVKELAKAWLEHAEKRGQLRARENFFVWKLRSRHQVQD